MITSIKKQNLFLILLIICIISRIATGIYYIEDIDSLRFALSIKEYDVAKLQPHFPGYPIFCFCVKALYFFVGSLGLSFSIIGGISLFIIIYSSLQLFQIQLKTYSGIFFASIIFFNPLFWLMSNRYMPDLMGLSISIMVLYFLIIKANESKFLILGFILSGILAGTRLSYMPLIFLPLIIHLFKGNRSYRLLFSFTVGCLIWLVPLVWSTGLSELYYAAIKQTAGHFSDFGGTIITEGMWKERIISVIRSIWADGLGGYWFGRSFQTLLVSIPMVYFLYHSMDKKIAYDMDKNTAIIIGSFLIYLVWILFFQNVIFKSRHVLPLIIICIFLINKGIQSLRDKDQIFMIVIAIFFLGLMNITSVLVEQHMRPNAISSLKDHLVNKNEKETIASIPLINYYLRYHGLKNQFMDIENENDVKKIKLLDDEKLILIGNFKNTFYPDYQVDNQIDFYHNPYVNRMWSEITMYRMGKK